MATKLERFELNRAGIAELLKGAAIQADLKARADRIAAQAGPGFVADVGVGANRARASVVTGDSAAMRAEATDRTLSRAFAQSA